MRVIILFVALTVVLLLLEGIEAGANAVEAACTDVVVTLL